jgi:hypothetical protein
VFVVSARKTCGLSGSKQHTIWATESAKSARYNIELLNMAAVGKAAPRKLFITPCNTLQ